VGLRNLFENARKTVAVAIISRTTPQGAVRKPRHRTAAEFFCCLVARSRDLYAI
jgi:hypothetical protein